MSIGPSKKQHSSRMGVLCICAGQVKQWNKTVTNFIPENDSRFHFTAKILWINLPTPQAAVLTIAICSSFSWRRRSLSIESSHRCCHRFDKCSRAGWFLSSVVEPDRVNEEPGLVNLSRDRSRVKDEAGLASFGILLLGRLPCLCSGVTWVCSGGAEEAGATEPRLLTDLVSLSYVGCFLAISSWKPLWSSNNLITCS